MPWVPRWEKKYRAVPQAAECVFAASRDRLAPNTECITGLSKHRIAYMGVTITKSMLWSVDRLESGSRAGNFTASYMCIR